MNYWGFLLLFCSSLMVQAQDITFDGGSDNKGTDDSVGVRLGLVASILGKDPKGETPSPLNGQGTPVSLTDLQQARDSNFCCCSSNGPTCPVDTQDPGATDYDSINVDIRNLPKPQNGGALDEVVTRIVNNPPSSPRQSDGCPSGQTRCCYSSGNFVQSLGSSCSPVGGGSSEPWNQLCQENVPPISQGSKGCGERSFQQVTSGLARGEASPEEFPWTCLILDGNNNFVGSCAIIPQRSDNDISQGTTKVITAAHKLKKVGLKDKLKVRVLEYDASAFKAPEREKHQEYTVVKITENPQYKHGRFTSDATILTVDTPINLLSHNGINAACIPTCAQMFDYKFSNGTGTRCWVAGWGKDKSNGNFQTVMHKVDVPLYDGAKCEQSLKAALIRENKQSTANGLRLHGSEICAGGEEGKDACDGDGGAPLVCQALSGRWYAVGLVTWGVSCAQSNVPGVYARISYFKDWIDRT